MFAWPSTATRSPSMIPTDLGSWWAQATGRSRALTTRASSHGRASIGRRPVGGSCLTPGNYRPDSYRFFRSSSAAPLRRERGRWPGEECPSAISGAGFVEKYRRRRSRQGRAERAPGRVHQANAAYQQNPNKAIDPRRDCHAGGGRHRNQVPAASQPVGTAPGGGSGGCCSGMSLIPARMSAMCSSSALSSRPTVPWRPWAMLFRRFRPSGSANTFSR